MDTALNLATVSSHPSVNCIQFSSDGQVLLATKSAVYILTPDLGINIDTSSTVKTNVSASETSKPISWFRTMIEPDKTLTHNWPLDSQEWGAVSFGSIDPNLRSVACSPAHLTVNAGCVIAILDSNMQLSIWTAVKNHLRGEWIKLIDVTALLKDHFVSREFASPIAGTLELQVTAIAWSPQANFCLVPAPAVNGSLLAAATRAGSLNLFRYTETDDAIGNTELVVNIPVGHRWVNHCAWSQWSSVAPGTCISLLACSLTDGSVVIVEVVQSLVVANPVSGFGPDFNIHTVASVKGADPLFVDKRGCTALKWINAPLKTPLLVHCKPGTVHLFSFPSPSVTWSGLVTVALQTQKNSTDSSALHPVSGIAYSSQHDSLIVSLFDGSFHVIQNLHTAPNYVSSGVAELTSKKMTSMARSLFLKAEGGNLQKDDSNRISGMMTLDDGRTFAWIHEACRPSDFSYKHEAKHNSMFVVGLTDAPADNLFLSLIVQTIHGGTAASGHSPINSLLPVLLQLREVDRLNRVLPQLLQVLESPVSDDPATMIVNPWTGDFIPEMRMAFRRQLMTHLFGWDSLVALRLKLAIADFCWKNLKDSGLQENCGKVAQTLLNSISHKVLRIILSFLTAVISVLTPNDIAFVYRIIIQSSLPGHPPDLGAQGQQLATAIRFVPQDASSTSEFGMNEMCPACHSSIPLHDINSGVCEKGHIWARCSVTSFILSTPKVRTCLGCTRKAFLPPPHGALDNLPQAARSWVVEELLHATPRCLFCGNRFVTII